MVGLCWSEVLGAAVAAFGGVELLGNMVGMWVWKGKASRRNESLSTVFDFVLFSGFFLRIVFWSLVFPEF